MNIQIDDVVEVVKQGKRKTVQLRQTSNSKEKIQPPLQQDIQINKQKLSLILNQAGAKQVDDLNARLNQIVNQQNHNFEQLVIINALNFVMQRKFVIKQLTALNKLKIKSIHYYQITAHPVGLVLKVILLLLQYLDQTSIKEINIVIVPCLQLSQLSQNELSRKGQGNLQNFQLKMINLQNVRIKIQKQFFSDVEIKWLLLLTNTLSQSQGLSQLSIDLGQCKLESDQFNKAILDFTFSKFQQLKSLILNVHYIEKNKEIILNENMIENIENLNLSFASISLDTKLFNQIIRFISKQKMLTILDLNLTLCALDVVKLQKLITVLLGKNLKNLTLNLSENIFCQTINQIPLQNNQQEKGQLINLNLNLNQCVWLCDQTLQPSPDFFILTAFNFQHLCLDLSGTKLDYDSLDQLGKELVASNCKALTIQLNNTRINFEQIIYFSKALQCCPDLLYLEVNLKNNQFDQTQIELILAAFIQMQLMQLNIFFDIDVRSQLIKNYALNNFCLLKSNLVKKQIQKVLHTRRILIYLMHKLEKFNIQPNIIQFLYDLWI